MICFISLTKSGRAIMPPLRVCPKAQSNAKCQEKWKRHVAIRNIACRAKSRRIDILFMPQTPQISQVSVTKELPRFLVSHVYYYHYKLFPGKLLSPSGLQASSFIAII